MSLSQRSLKALVLLALLAILGLWIEPLALLWRLYAALLLIALGLEVMWLNARVVNVERLLPAQAALGEVFEIRYLLDGPRTRVRFAEAAPDGSVGATLRGELSLELPAVVGSLRAMALGEIHFGALHIAVLGPLQLLWWPRAQAAAAQLTVLPAALMATEHTLPSDVGAQRVMKTPGDGTEHYGHRPYTPGDPVRAIDWKASARSAQTLIRLRERDEQLELAIMVDLSVSAERQFGSTRADHLRINCAARMAQWALARGERVSVVAYADQILRETWDLAGGVGSRRLKGAFTGLKVVPVAAHPLLAAQLLQQRLKRRALVIWFSDAAALSHERGLLRALKLIRLQHKSVVACPTDPAIRETLLAPGADWHAPNRRLAAEALQRRIDLAQAELRALGVSAVFEAPQALGRATFSAYARLKARRAI